MTAQQLCEESFLLESNSIHVSLQEFASKGFIEKDFIIELVDQVRDLPIAPHPGEDTRLFPGSTALRIISPRV
jgi:hypothetical protein